MPSCQNRATSWCGTTSMETCKTEGSRASWAALHEEASHVMAWWGIFLQGWSADAGCGYHTSPAYPAHKPFSTLSFPVDTGGLLPQLPHFCSEVFQAFAIPQGLAFISTTGRTKPPTVGNCASHTGPS